MKKFCKKEHPARSGKRLLALFMSLCLIGTMHPISARAENGSIDTGLCEHHIEHTSECGYAESSEGSPCTYVCNICEAQELIDVLPDAEDMTEENCDEAAVMSSASASEPVTPDTQAPSVKGKGLGISIVANPTATADTDSNWAGSFVYFGTYNGSPLKYRVLDRNTTDFSLQDNGTKAPTMLLDCDNILWTGISGDGQNSRFDNDSNVWADSEIKAYLNGSFLTDNFTPLEQAAIAASTKADKSTTDGDGKSELSYAALSGEQIFLLDAKEATNTSYGYSNTVSGVANRNKTGGSDGWWLRSADSDSNNRVGNVHSGQVLDCNVDNHAVGVSPALNVNLSSVIFSSVLSGTSGQSGAEYKLVLHDDKMTIEPGAITRNLSDVVTVPYTIGGDHAANTTQVSLMVLDKEYTVGNTNNAKLVAYEKIAAVDSANIPAAGISGTGTFTLTDDMKKGSYYSYIVAEDVQADNDTTGVNEALFTDYASAPQPIIIPARPTGIASVDITISQPVPEQKLARTAVVSTTGVATTFPAITWKKGSDTVTGAAGYDTSYTAEVTLSPDTGYEFVSGVKTNIKVDGTTVGSGTVSVNTNGSITVSYTFDDTGKANIPGIANPTADPAEGTYTSNQLVELRSSTEGAEIYYTTDGSTPSRTNGTKYTGAIPVTGTEAKSVQTTIKAIAVKSGMQDSEVVTFTYTIELPETTGSTLTAEEKKKNSMKLDMKSKAEWKGKQLKVTWGSVEDAEGYDIFAAQCGKKMTSKFLVKTVNGQKSSVTLAKIGGKKPSGSKSYMVQILAFKTIDGEKVSIGTSKIYHVAGKNSKTYTNAKKVKVSKKSVTIKKGKTSRIKATIVKQSAKKKLLGKSHGPALRYDSTDTSVATVTAKGKIKAKGKGTCYIYVTALNGVKTKVKVTVK